MSALLALPRRPTAVFVGNDAMAFGALEAAHVAGVAVPDDLAVIGSDDVQGAEHAHPPLTTVRFPTRELAHAVITVILRLIAGDSPPAPPSQGNARPPVSLLMYGRACGNALGNALVIDTGENVFLAHIMPLRSS